MRVAAGVIWNETGDQVLLAQRLPGVHLGGLWEFPGGKFEAGETVEQALRRELSEEIGIEVVASSPLIALENRYPDRTVSLHVREVRRFTGMPHGREGQLVRWVSPSALDAYPFPPANRPIIQAIRLPDRLAVVPLEGQREQSLYLLLDRLRAAGVRLIRFREGVEPLPNSALRTLVAAASLRDLKVMITGSPERASLTGAVGLHLKSSELSEYQSRPLSAAQILSVACHDERELQEASRLDPDFAVLGPVCPTLTHPEGVPLGWPRFAALVRTVNFPVYALGGVGPAQIEQAKAYGAQGVAAIRAFCDLPAGHPGAPITHRKGA